MGNDLLELERLLYFLSSLDEGMKDEGRVLFVFRLSMNDKV